VVRVKIRITFRFWFVSGYAHVFMLLSVVIVPYLGGRQVIYTLDSK